MKKTSIILIVLIALALVLGMTACGGKKPIDPDNPGGDGDGKIIGWDGKSVTYTPSDIKLFGSAIPSGMANYNAELDVAEIWNTDAALDNYGGVQTPSLTLDFSKAVIFRMEVVSCYSQYIVKLAVEGELEYYYVLSDEGDTGVISVNVTRAMLSDKYRAKNTQPDPGYADGWKYAGQKKNCSFHILAKGPDGESQTAELVVKSISVFNDTGAISKVEILSGGETVDKLEAAKGGAPVTLSHAIYPSELAEAGVIWSTMDAGVATVSQNGKVEFVGVGKTYITAVAATDRSMSSSVEVDVKSGYEKPNDLKARLDTLQYGGASDNESFLDLYRTSWASPSAMNQTGTVTNVSATESRVSGNIFTIENYFDANNSAYAAEAENRVLGGKAHIGLSLDGSGSATVYRSIAGKLYKESYSGSLKAAYAEKQGVWQKLPTYTEYGIVVWSGEIKKYEIEVVSAQKVASYRAEDFANASLWTVPDRSKQGIDAVVHALSPASVSVSGGALTMRQNKYPEAKYCFGGIVSNVLTSSGQTEIILDIDSLNQKSDFVKTMWEVKILYYGTNGIAVSTNPLKLESGNTPGVKTISFTPKYDNFRLYLVVNGSDIGEQFPQAEMKVNSMKIYSRG